MAKKTIENLITFDQMDEEKHRELSRKAGIASAESKKKKKQLRQIAQEMLSLPIPENELKAKIFLQDMGISDGDMQYGVAMMAMMLTKAINGDVNAAKFVRDTAGYDPDLQLKEKQYEYIIKKEKDAQKAIQSSGDDGNVVIYLPAVEEISEEDDGQ